MSLKQKTIVAALVAFIATTFSHAVADAQDEPVTGLAPTVVTEQMSDAEALSNVSYIFGYNAVRGILEKMKSERMDVDEDRFLAGAQQAIKGLELDIDPVKMQQIQTAMNGIMVKKKEALMAEMKAKAAENLAKGRAFMKENATKPGVEIMDNGVHYTIMTAGDGPKPKPSDTVKLNYHGTFIDGEVFDSSLQEMNGHGIAPITNSASGFVKGFNAAVQAMPVGSKWKIVIPADQAYGAQGGPGGPNQTLVFEVELLEIVQGDAPAGGAPKQ
jgi:FKBP-type peptidyl-prolyl cis-trans isomerase